MFAQKEASMGQYYMPTILAPDGRMLTLEPHDFDCGAKLTEHSWVSNPHVNAAYALIYDSPKRVAWIGAYADQEYAECGEPYTMAMPPEEFAKIYKSVYDENRESLKHTSFSRSDLEILMYDTKRRFLVNHRKSCYLDLEFYILDSTYREIDSTTWCVSPLPLLTACGNGRGGGDYYKGRPCYEAVGTWAFDTLEFTASPPSGYEEAFYTFRDQ
jgi:hypothetical protein